MCEGGSWVQERWRMLECKLLTPPIRYSWICLLMSLMHRLLQMAGPNWILATTLPQLLDTRGVISGRRCVPATRTSATLVRQRATAAVPSPINWSNASKNPALSDENFSNFSSHIFLIESLVDIMLLSFRKCWRLFAFFFFFSICCLIAYLPRAVLLVWA